MRRRRKEAARRTAKARKQAAQAAQVVAYFNADFKQRDLVDLTRDRWAGQICNNPYVHVTEAQRLYKQHNAHEEGMKEH